MTTILDSTAAPTPVLIAIAVIGTWFLLTRGFRAFRTVSGARTAGAGLRSAKTALIITGVAGLVVTDAAGLPSELITTVTTAFTA